MEWRDTLLKICKREHIELFPASTPEGQQAIVFYRERPLEDSLVKEIESLVPKEIGVGFKYQDKPQTIPALIATLLISGARSRPQFKIEGHHLIIDISGLEEERVDRMKIDTILEQDGYLQSWTVNINGQKLYDMNLIGRRLSLEIQNNKKIRNQVFTDSDMTDLKISLETCRTVDEFLKVM